jgi:hypothetical protein
MMEWLRKFPELSKKRRGIMVCRVRDLLDRGFDSSHIVSEFIRINRAVWDGITHPEYVWTEEMLRSQFRTCPEHLYCAFEDGRMVGTASGFLCHSDDLKRYKTWLEKTDNGRFTHHRPDGKIAFGADLSVERGASPEVSMRLMLALLVCGVLGNGIKSLYLGSRIPGYHKHRHMSVEDYVFGKRKSGKPLDPELYFYMKDGFKLVEIIPGYMHDPKSLNYGVLVRWDNPLYRVTNIFPFLRWPIRIIGGSLLLRTPPEIAK